MPKPRRLSRNGRTRPTGDIAILFDLAKRHPDRSLQVFEDDVERARSELFGSPRLVPFFTKDLALSIVALWAAISEIMKQDAAAGAELLWVDVQADGTIRPVYRDRTRAGSLVRSST